MYKEKLKLLLFTSLAVLGMMVLFTSCSSREKTDSLNPSSNKAIDHETLIMDIDSLLSSLRLDTIDVAYDWIVKKENKRYQGISTKILFSRLVEKHNIDTSYQEVIFLCDDGYSSRIPFNTLMSDEGYLVNKDIDSELQWEKEINDKFGKAYLVWDIDEKDNSHSFPYGILQIKIVSIEDEYQRIKPNGSSEKVAGGYSLFKEHCIKCHMVNGVGGEVGPELNQPMSVTEYWKAEHLENFILDPQQYRSNSKMPITYGLTKDDSKQIIEYLKYMSNNKISSNE